jgi:hypothetical protein
MRWKLLEWYSWQCTQQAERCCQIRHEPQSCQTLHMFEEIVRIEFSVIILVFENGRVGFYSDFSTYHAKRCVVYKSFLQTCPIQIGGIVRESVV